MAEDSEKPAGGGGKGPLVVGALLALVMGGAGFYVVYDGMVELPIPPAQTAEEVAKEEAIEEFEESQPPTAFAELEPIVVSLGGGESAIRQLQFVAQLEVEPHAATQVASLQPRVRDVLNTYLRAVKPQDVEDPAALMRMRAQMLRRVQVVAGEGAVRDLLVSEFILR